MGRKLVRLRNEQGQFFDPDTHFRLRGAIAKPHPPEVGRLTREWIAAGGIIVFDENPPPPSPPEPEVEEIPFEERVTETMGKFSIAEMRAMLRDAEVTFSWNAKEKRLAEQVCEAGLR